MIYCQRPRRGGGKREGTHVELLGRERSRSDARRVGLDDSNDLSDRFGRQSQASADSSDSSRRRGDVGVRSKVEVEHESVGALDEDALVRRHGLVEKGRSVDDVRREAGRESPVANDLAFSVVPAAARLHQLLPPRSLKTRANALKVAVALEAALDETPELRSEELLVEEVVDAESTAGRLGRVRWSDSLLGRSDRRTA